MTADGLDGLEDVHLTVLDDLLDAGVGRAVHAAPARSNIHFNPHIPHIIFCCVAGKSVLTMSGLESESSHLEMSSILFNNNDWSDICRLLSP